jgi:S-methylmethionine-dependent homocysteine/selenocysteine methylase
MAQELAAAGVDLMLCETFPHVGEALIAIEEAVATGVETWASFTAGPDGSLLTPAEIEGAACEAARRGARCVLVNCTAASRILPFVERLAKAGVPSGAYANAGPAEEGLGWTGTPDVERYAMLAAAWAGAGATILGGCCGTGPAHIRAMATRFGGAS